MANEQKWNTAYWHKAHAENAALKINDEMRQRVRKIRGKESHSILLLLKQLLLLISLSALFFAYTKTRRRRWKIEIPAKCFVYFAIFLNKFFLYKPIAGVV